MFRALEIGLPNLVMIANVFLAVYLDVTVVRVRVKLRRLKTQIAKCSRNFDQL